MQNNSNSRPPDYERDLWEMQARQNSFRKFQLVFQIYTILGLVIGLGSLAIFLLRQLKVELSIEDQMILMVAGSGLTMSIFSALVFFLRQQRNRLQLDRSRFMSAAAEFLFQWAIFETMSRERLEAAEKIFNPMSIRAITSELVNSKIISPDEMVQLEEILRFRNVLVHSGNSPDPAVLARMTETLRKVMARVEA